MFYTVSEVARRLGMSPHTIRFYGKEGLLDFVERDKNGNRIFKESDFERLFIIASLKRAKMSISQMHEFTALCDEGDSTVAERLDILKRQKRAVEEEIAGLNDAMDVLRYKIWLYETAIERGLTAEYTAIPAEEMPAEIRAVKEKIRALTDDMEQRFKDAAIAERAASFATAPSGVLATASL